MTARNGFWRTVAGAFVQMEEPRGDRSAAPADASPELDADALLRELNSGRREPPPAGASAPRPPAPAERAVAQPLPSDASGISENVPLGDIYASAGVAGAQYAAEQMLAILDGLAAMPPDAVRLAVKAMDDADDRWTVSDVLQDAHRKVEALATYAGKLGATAQAAVEKATSERAEIDQVLAEAEQTIQQQIAQLQAELASFRTDAEARRAEVEATLSSTRDGVARESARVQAEIARLGRIRTFLEPMVAAPRAP